MIARTPGPSDPPDAGGPSRPIAPTRLALLTALALGFAALAGIAIGAVAWLSLPAVVPPSSTSGAAIWPVAPTPTGLARDTAIRPAAPAPPLQLTDQDGRPFDLASLRGRPVLVFFGYTHCPDVCPTTLSTMNSVTKKLAAAKLSGAPVRVVFVSIDPERDTIQHLAEYVPYFNKDFLGVTGTPAQVDAFTKQLNILHMRGSEPASDGNYTMDHTASILLIDPRARFSAIFSAPHVANAITQDFLSLRKYYEDP